MKTIYTALLIFTSFFIHAQDFPYAFTVDSQAYKEISDGTSVNNGEIWDDPLYTFPLGFDFSFFGVTTSQLSIDDFFTGGIVSNYPLSQPESPLIVIYDADLIDRGELSGVSESPISYITEGEPGNRIFKLQWKNAGFFNEVNDLRTANSFVNFQLWLYEGSNTIEIHFGPSNITSPDLLYEFFNGPLIGLVESFHFENNDFEKFWYLKGNPAAPLINQINIEQGDTLTQVLLGTPADGTVYRFATKTTSTSDFFTPISIKLYPTIAQNWITIEFAEKDITNLKYSIVNTEGKTLKEGRIQHSVTELNVSDLQAGGLYFIHFSHKNMIIETKYFIKK